MIFFLNLFIYYYCIYISCFALFSLFRAMSLIKEGIDKVTRPGLTSDELLKQTNITADAIRKPKKFWTESESSDVDGN